MLSRRFAVLLLLLGLYSLLPSTASAAIKLLVICQTPRFTGTQIEVPLVLVPFGQDTRAVTVSGARTVIVGTTASAQLRALIIARVQSEYTVTLTDDEILLKGCF